VVNRSQKDINEDLPIRQGLIKEQKFFQSHPKYRDTLSKCGTSNLARSLNQILMLHIRDSLPDIKSRIVALLNSVQVRPVHCTAYSPSIPILYTPFKHRCFFLTLSLYLSNSLSPPNHSHTSYNLHVTTLHLTPSIAIRPTKANIDILGEPADAQGASKMGTFALPYGQVQFSVTSVVSLDGIYQSHYHLSAAYLNESPSVFIAFSLFSPC
jgi:hypothetical protein